MLFTFMLSSTVQRSSPTLSVNPIHPIDVPLQIAKKKLQIYIHRNLFTVAVHNNGLAMLISAI